MCKYYKLKVCFKNIYIQFYIFQRNICLFMRQFKLFVSQFDLYLSTYGSIKGKLSSLLTSKISRICETCTIFSKRAGRDPLVRCIANEKLRTRYTCKNTVRGIFHCAHSQFATCVLYATISGTGALAVWFIQNIHRSRVTPRESWSTDKLKSRDSGYSLISGYAVCQSGSSDIRMLRPEPSELNEALV